MSNDLKWSPVLLSNRTLSAWFDRKINLNRLIITLLINLSWCHIGFLDFTQILKFCLHLLIPRLDLLTHIMVGDSDPQCSKNNHKMNLSYLHNDSYSTHKSCIIALCKLIDLNYHSCPGTAVWQLNNLQSLSETYLMFNIRSTLYWKLPDV